MLQSALVLGGGSSVPDGDGGGEDGLNDECVEVHYHWQVEFIQLPEEVNPLLSFLDEVLGDASPSERKYSTASIVKSERVTGAGEVEFFLKSTTISTVFRPLSSRLFCLLHLPTVGGLVTIINESDESGVVRELQELDGLMTGGAAVCVQGKEQRRKNTALGGSGADGL